MLIQCNIQRDGDTQMFLDKFPYLFKVRPELTGNNEDKVCPVASRSHQNYFLSLPDFCEWQPKEEQEPKEITAEDIAQMKAMQAEGKKVTEIGAAFGIPWQSVNKLLKVSNDGANAA